MALKAKLLRDGSRQVVVFPEEFRLPVRKVRVRRLGRGILLEPPDADIDTWNAEFESISADPVVTEQRSAPLSKRKPTR